MHDSINTEVKPIIAFYAKGIKLLAEYQEYLDLAANNPYKYQDLNEYCILAYESEGYVILEICGVVDDIPFQTNRKIKSSKTLTIKEEIYNIITMFKKHHRYILQFKNSKNYHYIELTNKVDDWIFKKIQKEIDKQEE